MLARTSGVAKPAVVGDVDDEACTCWRLSKLIGEESFIADNPEDRRQASDLHKFVRLSARRERASAECQRIEPGSAEQGFKRYEFAEWNQVNLVIDSRQLSLVIKYKNAVIGCGGERRWSGCVE